MAFTKITKDMNIIAALDDEPNDVGGLTAAQLKAKFDEGGLALKTFINNWIDSIAAGTAAANIGALDANEDATDLQTALDNLAGAVIGTLPDGSVTTAKLHDGAVTNAKIADSAVSEAKIDWTTANILRYEKVTYTGTGTYGVDHKNTMTFTHVPKFVIFFKDRMTGADGTYLAFIDWALLVSRNSEYQTNFILSLSGTNIYEKYKLTNDNKTVTWYCNSATMAEHQMNENGATYTAVSFY